MNIEELGKIVLKKPASEKVVKKLLDLGYIPDLLDYEVGDDYYDIIEQWKLTFVGAYASKYLPLRTNVITDIADGLGRLPVCDDFTRLGIERILNILEERASRGICKNTLYQYAKEFKAVLNELNYDVELPYRGYNKSLTLKKEDSQFVYLTEQEIERLDAYEPENENEKFVKKLFMISCYTGCRHSDAIRLNMTHVNRGVLSFVTQKTKTNVTMKAKPALIKYLQMNVKEYKGDCLSILKGMCKKVRINAMTTCYTKGAEYTKPKWFFVSPHTARRSFATNLHLRGADLNTIKHLMGHSDISVTQGYICSVKDLGYLASKFFD